MTQFLQENSLYLIIGGFAIYFIIMIVYMINKKKKDKQFEQDNEDVAKVHIESGMQLRANDKLRMFSEGMHTGYYFFEGEHTIYVTFYYETFRKRITVQESPLKIKVEVSKEYDLTYDTKKEVYVFTER